MFALLESSEIPKLLICRKLATEMQQLKSRASVVLAQSIRIFLNGRKDRRQRDLERAASRQEALNYLPPKPWKAIVDLGKNIVIQQRRTGNDLWRLAAKRLIIAERLSQGAMIRQKYRPSPLVDAAASGNTKLLEEFLVSRRSLIARKNEQEPKLMRNPSKQAIGSMVRLRPVSPRRPADRASGGRPPLGDDELLQDNLRLLRDEDLNIPDITRKTPLQAALERGHWDCVALLLAEPDISVSVQDQRTGDTILHTLLASRTAADRVGALLPLLLSPRFRFDLATCNRAGATVLHVAAGNSWVADDPDWNGAGARRRSSIDAAAPPPPPPPRRIARQPTVGLDVLRTLLDRRADINAQDGVGRYPVEWAAAAGLLEHVRLLVEWPGAGPEHAHRALFAGIPREGRANLELLEYLIRERGAAPRQDDGRRDNVLISAARHGQLEAVRALLSWPFLPPDLLGARDADGYTALHAAVRERHNEIALLLIKFSYGHSVLDEHADIGVLGGGRSGRGGRPRRSIDRDSEEEEGSAAAPLAGSSAARARAHARHGGNRRGALIVATAAPDSGVFDGFLFSVAAQVRGRAWRAMVEKGGALGL